MSALPTVTPDALRDLGACMSQVDLFARWLAERGWTSARPTPRNLEAAARYGLNACWLIERIRLNTCFVDNGPRKWFKCGRLHRDDGPAVEHANCFRAWYRDGLLHRDDGPAIECADGSRFWYKYGFRHRDGGPAVERADGSREYWTYGRFVRRVV